MNYLLDTNVVSEVMRQNPEAAVVDWMEANRGNCFLSIITVGEIEKGIELLPAGRRKQRLREAFSGFLLAVDDRLLGVDLAVARRWAKLTASAQHGGRRLPVLDSLIEATALNWSLTIVTRNGSDFKEAHTLNPWVPGD